jgi:uncharacterized BrkB/YihY/UPF0761 family membrane protein
MSASHPNSTPTEPQRRHSRRKLLGRLHLAGIFLVLCVAFGLLFSFATSGQNQWRILIGVLFGSAVSSALLLGATWSRQNWARYVLLLLLLGLVAIFGMCLIVLISDPSQANSPGVRLIGYGLLALLVSATWLMFSRRIRYLTTPAGSGG